MNIYQLKNIIQNIPDEYEVELSINEESDTLNHIFIDNDFGNVELTNFKEDTPSIVSFIDMFDNTITAKTHVLFLKEHNSLSIGTVVNISNYDEETDEKYDDWYKVIILDKFDNKHYNIFVNKKEKSNKIIKYNW